MTEGISVIDAVQLILPAAVMISARGLQVATDIVRIEVGGGD